MSAHQHIYLQKNERTELEQMIKSGVHSARVIARARALLLLDRSEGETRTIEQVIDAAMISQGTIYNLKKRYFSEGLNRALYEMPRPGAKPKIDGEVEAHLVALACSNPPEGYDRWTLRLLADRLVSLEIIDSISHVAVGEALKKMNLSPGK
ncbi:helix-turn-helix domain-containing protein [Promineifilum sp.]|uniref:helix-turn-helix domain-containing protein n=1 Tax=Promineifilum sp. TaxID=2664178 RepID=UPI0035B2E4D2